MIVVGLIRETAGNLPQQNVHHLHGLFGIGHATHAWPRSR